MAFDVVKLLHILSMAVWFGVGLGVAGDVRRTIARGKPHTEMLAARVGRTLTIAAVGGLATICTGIALILLSGGMKGVPPRIHAGLGISLVAYALLLVVIRPAAARLDEVLAKGNTDEATSIAKRLAMTTGIDHLLKLSVLVLMVLPLGR